MNEPVALPMTPPLPPKNSEPTPRWRRWQRKVLLVVLVGISVLGWHEFTGRRAIRQLREAGFYSTSEDTMLGARLWKAARCDLRLLFSARTWAMEPSVWQVEESKVGQLRNFDAFASALRRVNPEALLLYSVRKPNSEGRPWGLALENVDGLAGVTALRLLALYDCLSLQNVDGLKGLTSLGQLEITGCRALNNIDVLKGLTGLKGLSLRGAVLIRNVDVLKGLTALTQLDLSYCRALESVGGLKGLPSLIKLSLEACSELHDVDGIKGLTLLQELDLRGCTKLRPEQVAALKEALPNARILYP